jgi:histidine phosphotransferase ChpT
MNDLDFAALLVSRVCHDLVSPVGAVVNGLEILADERDPAMRADALKLVTSSADQAAARLQFARIAYGAAGSAGATLELTELGRVVGGLLSGGKIAIEWDAANTSWPKDWAKLLMNGAVIAAESLPRGGHIRVETSPTGSAPEFRIRATGQGARVREEIQRALKGEPVGPIDGRSIQPFLTYKLAQDLNAALTLAFREGEVELTAA